MSDLLKLMEEYIEADRYPSLIKFCSGNEGLVKSYIRHFDTAAAAKKNLQNKMGLAHHNVHKGKKRSPGLQVDVDTLFAEAKAATAITVAGWESLAASVEQAQEKLTSTQAEGNEVESAHENAEDGQTDEGYPTLLDQFVQYKKAAELIAKERGFYVDGNLHEIACLNDVLFLKENEYSDEQLSHFGFTNLEELRGHIIEEYMDQNEKFDDSFFHQISEILRNFRPQDGRRRAKQQLNELLKGADDVDYKLIEILINCFNKLPLFSRLDEEIGEAELQGNYIDPIVYPMFHDPEDNIYFRWLNRQTQDTEARRPDGHIYKMKQRRIVCSVGFVEVKAEKSNSLKQHEDMLRLIAFCKDALENQSRKETMIAVQVVGCYISFYIFVRVDGLYLMVDLLSFETAKHIGELPLLLNFFDKLKRIMICSRVNGLANQEMNRKRNSSVDQATLLRISNIKKPRSLSASLSFKK
ncbi:hypothetical protein BDF20DRAFT_856753 [Mycotypha africana]|uniref:uncharacterized protein n=1 Tax=Mycotypha africana TaxID=64632 RepID=UPI0022FFC483|nr:uncharacterized protein BDF20DRAFT_856753 [Mycotypha africana]KAI8988615.1 hypothetical protein BDF20DRAFT_856753 [Mycotypha africana]